MFSRVFKNMKEIEDTNKASGFHWFDPQAVSCFRSHVHRTVYAGRYFISSEQEKYSSVRKWSIREVDYKGRIHCPYGFMAFNSFKEAKEAANQLGNLAPVK